jgi:hypothetical protein
VGKKDGKKKPKSPQRSGEDAPSPAHHASEVVTELHRTPAMVADSDAEIAQRMQRSSSGANNLDHELMTDAETKMHRQTSGQFTGGPSVDMPTAHSVVQVDLNDAGQSDGMRRAPTSAPNGPPVGPNDSPAVHVLDAGDLQGLTE